MTASVATSTPILTLEDQGDMTIEDVYAYMYNIAVNNPEQFETERSRLLKTYAKGKQPVVQSSVNALVIQKGPAANTPSAATCDTAAKDAEMIIDAQDASSPEALAVSNINRLKLLIAQNYSAIAGKYGLYAWMDKLEELRAQKRYIELLGAGTMLESVLSFYTTIYASTAAGVDASKLEAEVKKLKDMFDAL